MNNEIEAGDDVFAGCQNARAKVIGIDNRLPKMFLVRYYGSSGKLDGRQYSYSSVTLCEPKEEKLYTINGGTTLYKIVAEFEEYLWVKNTETPWAAPCTVPKKSVRETPPYHYLTCSVAGSSMSVHKKTTDKVKKGETFVTKHGTVITVEKVESVPPLYGGKTRMTDSAVPHLEARKIEFV